MATSVVEIANLALTYLGAELVVSLDDPHKSARLLKQTWPTCRDAVLRAALWNCVTREAVLPPTSAPAETGWSHASLLPADCLRVIRLLRDEPFVVRQRMLMSHANPAIIQYIAAVEDVSVYDALLVQALAAYWAHALCLPLTQSNSLKEHMWEQYRLFVREARSVDAQEGSLQLIEASDWVAARI